MNFVTMEPRISSNSSILRIRGVSVIGLLWQHSRNFLSQDLPISMVLRSEGSLRLEMLSLARTSKYVDNTSVLSINKTEEDG